MILHPERRMAPLQQLKEKWGVETVNPAYNRAMVYWEIFQRDNATKSSSCTTPQPPQVPGKQVSKLGAKLKAMTISYSESSDELQEYLSQTAGVSLAENKPSNVIEWWFTQRNRWPTLTKLAVEIFSIPAMSDDIERVFSGARRTISWERSKLNPETVEAIECLASWFPYSLEKFFPALDSQVEEVEEGDLRTDSDTESDD